jgi:hypothetical protein
MTSSNRAPLPKFHIVEVMTRSGLAAFGSSRGHHGKPLRGPQWQIMTDRVSDTL